MIIMRNILTTNSDTFEATMSRGITCWTDASRVWANGSSFAVIWLLASILVDLSWNLKQHRQTQTYAAIFVALSVQLTNILHSDLRFLICIVVSISFAIAIITQAEAIVVVIINNISLDIENIFLILIITVFIINIIIRVIIIVLIRMIRGLLLADTNHFQ